VTTLPGDNPEASNVDDGVLGDLLLGVLRNNDADLRGPLTTEEPPAYFTKGAGPAGHVLDRRECGG